MEKMNREEIKQKLWSIKNNSQYVRVNETHSLELYLGKNEKGFLTLRYNGDFQPIKIIGSGLLEVKQVKTSIYYSLMFCYTSNENLSLFFNFCEDIISQTEKYKGKDGYHEIINRYSQWRKMFFGGVKVLNENEVMGLIGELLFLKNYVFPKYGESVGLNGWSGPEPTHKDFSYDDEWFEIKTMNSSRDSISVSSIEQLDSISEGRLVVFALEKMSPSFSGINLNDLVIEISFKLEYEIEKDVFLEKLKQVDYSFNELYNNYMYNLISCDTYLVMDGFPRIKAEGLPLGVIKIHYDLLLSSIEQFKEKR
jgi:hypothetical protein